MRRILSFVQQQCGGQWVGLSVIHLGATTVLSMMLAPVLNPTNILFLPFHFLTNYRGPRCTQCLGVY